MVCGFWFFWFVISAVWFGLVCGCGVWLVFFLFAICVFCGLVLCFVICGCGLWLLF